MEPQLQPVNEAQGIRETTNQINDVIRQWMPKVRTAMKASARWFSDGKTEPFVIRKGKQLEGKLVNSIETKPRSEYGRIIYIGVQMERHGVFVHKGVGRKYPIQGGQTINNPSGRARVAVEWFNPVLERYVPELADKLAEINANAAIDSIRMRIH